MRGHNCETVLMRGHNVCFYAKIWKIIPKLSLLPLLIWSTEVGIVKGTFCDKDQLSQHLCRNDLIVCYFF